MMECNIVGVVVRRGKLGKDGVGDSNIKVIEDEYCCYGCDSRLMIQD